MGKPSLVALLVMLLAAACAPGGGDAGVARPPDAAQPPGEATASPAPLLQKITLAYTSLSGSQMPIYLAVENGLFARHGLDVETPYIASGTVGMQSLLANDIQFSGGSSAEVAAAHLGGASPRLLLGWINTFPSLFMVDPSITTPAQLRGTSIGVTRLGTQAHSSARLALKYWGLNPDTDVQYVQLGGVPEILAGMQVGAVVGGAFTPPTNIRARRLGFHALGDLSKMGIPYQATSLVALQPYVEANPALVRRLVQALLDGIHLYHTDDAASRAALAKYTRTEDVEMLDATIAFYRTIVQRAPYPSLDGLQTVLDDLTDSNPAARTIEPRQLVDSRALEQLEAEGYLEHLYGDRPLR